MSRSSAPLPRRPRVVATVALASLLLGVTSCGSSPEEMAADAGSDVGSEWDEIVQMAKDEGSVSLYSAQAPQTLERIKGCFEEEYPDISVDAVRGTSGDLLSRIDQERQSGSDGADVWVTTELAWFKERSDEGALLAPQGPAAEDWPEEYLDGETVIAGVEPLIISYNTDLVTTPPAGYEDLLSPDLQGKVGTSELAATVISAWYAWLEETHPGYLEDLANQNPRLYVGSVPISQAVASGEIAASAYGIPTAVEPLIKEGAPIDYVVPDPSFGVSYGTAAFGWSQQPNAALVLIDFLMSADGQECWHGAGESASPLGDVPGALDIDSIEPWDYTEFSEDDAAQLEQEWNSLFLG